MSHMQFVHGTLLQVTERLKAPRVAPLDTAFGLKNQEPYTPDMVVCMVFFSHSDIQYIAKVTNTNSPMTLPFPQFPTPLLHCELFWFGVYWT